MTPSQVPASTEESQNLNDTVCVAGGHVKEKEETNRIWELLNT